MKTLPGIQKYKVAVEFVYEVEAVPGDPDDLDELADLEIPEFYATIKGAFPGLDPESINLDIEAL